MLFRETACRRHLRYFNTHPFLVTYVAGAVARLEEDGRTEESVKLKNSMMGPLGAVGDGFFWAKVRPAAVLLGLVASFAWPWAAIPVLLLAFNGFHIPDRWSGVKNGYGGAEGPLAGISAMNRKATVRYSKHLITTGCGFILGATAFRIGAPALTAAMFCFAFALFRGKLKTVAVLGCLLAAGLILGALGVGIGLPWSV